MLIDYLKNTRLKKDGFSNTCEQLKMIENEQYKIEDVIYDHPILEIGTL
jgi:hypothetical protein